MNAKLNMIQTLLDKKFITSQVNLTKNISNRHSKVVEPVLKFGVPFNTTLNVIGFCSKMNCRNMSKLKNDTSPPESLDFNGIENG